MSSSEQSATALAQTAGTRLGIKPLLCQAEVSPLARMVRDSVAEATWSAYVSDLRDYECFVHGRDWSDPRVLADYIGVLGDVGAKFTTIERRVAAVGKLVELAAACGHLEMSNPSTSPLVRTRLSVVRRNVRSDVECATPLIARLRDQVLASIDVATTAGLRDAALISLGWWGALRRSELAGLLRADVDISTDGVVLSLRSTKTAQSSSVKVKVPRREKSETCPVGLLEQWLYTTNEAARDVVSDLKRGDVWLRVQRHGAVYLPVSGLSGDAVARIIERRVRAAGLSDSKSFSAHSLRSGFITEAKGQDIDEATIMRHTRHKSVIIMRSYDRPDADDLQRNAAAQLRD